MRVALAAILFAMAFLPGCQERPEVFHVLPAYQRGLLALASATSSTPLPDPGRR